MKKLFLPLLSLLLFSCQSNEYDDVINTRPYYPTTEYHALWGTIGDQQVQIKMNNDFSPVQSKAYAFFSDGKAAEQGCAGMHWEARIATEPETWFSLHLPQPTEGISAITTCETAFNASEGDAGLPLATSGFSVMLKDVDGNSTAAYGPDEKHPLEMNITHLAIKSYTITSVDHGESVEEVIYRYEAYGRLTGSVANLSDPKDVKPVSLRFCVITPPAEGVTPPVF